MTFLFTIYKRLFFLANISLFKFKYYRLEVFLLPQINHTGLISGLNELGQIEMSVKAAQKLVGSATMQQDPEALQHAENAIRDAKDMMNRTPQTGVDQEFLAKQQQLLDQCEHQLNEARH
jgi:hypothetical protein